MDEIKGLSFINPASLYDPTPYSYSQLTQFPADWRIVMASGQGPGSVDAPFGETFREQFRQAMENVRRVLEPAGATLKDIAKVVVYVVDHDEEKFDVYREEMTRLFGDRYPACTLVPVPALAQPGMMVEIDPVAVVPNR